MLEKHFKSQQYYTNEFYQACINGDFELAVCLLKMGVNLNVRFEHGQNLLHIACMKNFYGLVQLLIKFGCNEFLKDNYGRTALHYAALNNSTSIVRYLVEKNTFANNINTDMLTKEFLNCQDVDGKTAIHLASENNFKEPIMIILSSGLANINLEDHNTQSPLAISYTKKFWEIFEMLIKNGSNISRYILKDICVQGDLTALNILLRYFDSKSLASMIDLASNDDKKNSFLYLAMKYSSNLEFLNKLFEIGLKINSKDLKDFYIEIKFFTKSNQYNNLIKFNYFLECIILLIKFNCFNTKLTKYQNIMSIFNSIELKNDINFGQKSNILNHIIILYLNLIYDFYSNLILNHSSELFKNECDYLNLTTRVYYLFALAIYSSQLDTRRKFVQKWFEKKFINSPSSSSNTNSNSNDQTNKSNNTKTNNNNNTSNNNNSNSKNSKSTTNNQSNNKNSKTNTDNNNNNNNNTNSTPNTSSNSETNLTNSKLKVTEIYKESVNSPWSLQMLCRCKIKNDINNIDYVLNDKSLIKSLKLPNICVRYLKYEFI